MRYFFILGRNPELSLAELDAVLPRGYQPLAIARQILLIEGPELDSQQLMRRLGGTIKLGKLIGSPLHDFKLATPVGKTFIGLSAYALDEQARLPSLQTLRALGIKLKRELQAQKHKVRLVTSREIALSSVIVKREKLLTQGAEIVLIYGSPTANQPLAPSPYTLVPQFIGRTLAVQEFEEASARDFGRPVREMKVGMLPIQLAKIMLNLSGTPLTGTILDPFCGFGTVLSEARAMGYTKLIGTDSEQKMIDATRKNLEWLNRIPPTHNSPQPSLNLREGVKLITTPVQELSKHLPPHSVDAIVTEPDMGPTREIKNSKFKIQNLTDLYITTFGEFSKVLKPGGRVVFIFPAFKHGAALTKTSAHVLPKIKILGFQPNPLTPSIQTVNCELKSVNSIIYSRPDQRVLREIFVLQFKPLP